MNHVERDQTRGEVTLHPSGDLEWKKGAVKMEFTGNPPRLEALDTSMRMATVFEPNIVQIAEFEADAVINFPDAEKTLALGKYLDLKDAALREQLNKAEKIRITTKGGNPQHLTANYDPD